MFSETMSDFFQFREEVMDELNGGVSLQPTLPPRVLEAQTYLDQSMRSLAEQHAEAVARLDWFSDDIDNAVKTMGKRLKKAKRELIKQCDTRFGDETTDKALRALGFNTSVREWG